MQTASRDLSGPGGAPRIERVVLTSLVVVFVAIVAIGGIDAARQVERLKERRATVQLERWDPAQVAGGAAEAFRVFRRELDEGTRFALVYGPDIDRDQRGFYRLFGGYYLYPAIAVDRPEVADAVMVFGSPSSSLQRSFAPITSLDGVWLGRRKDP